MSGGTGSAKLESLRLEGAERRVRHDLAVSALDVTHRRRAWVLPVAFVLFMGGFALRLSIDDPGALVANFYTVPIALVAIAYGLRAALAAAGFALFLVWAWGQFESQHVGVLGYSTRLAVFLVVGTLVGWYSERLRQDVAERRRAEHELALRADELARSNDELAEAVMRLEAFAKIARAVGGETELRRVLELILDQARSIVDARLLAVYLREGDELALAASTEPLPPGAPERMRDTAGLRLGDGETLVVPLVWQGETLGALAAAAPSFDGDAKPMMRSVATSAATAVATVKSVAEDRLRHTLEASEEARARWARELHDETLQGLVGLRMLLSSARRADSPEPRELALSEALEQTREAILNLRGLIAELRPAALDELGLGPAIATLAERSAAHADMDVETHLELRDGEVPRLAPETETTIYRVVQEALTNAARHSGARAVRVDVVEDDGSIEVAVADDGHGFDPQGEPGFGLAGMRERVGLAGGELTVESGSRGSTVRARLPANRARPVAAR